jgi:2-dehydropantoate 2-reductase
MHGIQLQNAVNGRKTTVQVPIVEQLTPTDSYDVVIVAVRLNQLSAVLPILAANNQVSTLLFLLSNPTGMQQFALLDPQRIVLGFPAIGGVRKEDVIHYITPPTPTMLGEVDGRVTPRLHQLAAIFKQAGFKAGLSPYMQTWLQTHALMDISIISATIRAGRKSALLARSRPNAVLLVQAIREGLLALGALGTPLTPFYLTVLFLRLPRWVTVTLMQVLLRTRLSALGIDPHLDDDIEEYKQMARELMGQLSTSLRATPTLKSLLVSLEQSAH